MSGRSKELQCFKFLCSTAYSTINVLAAFFLMGYAWNNRIFRVTVPRPGSNNFYYNGDCLNYNSVNVSNFYFFRGDGDCDLLNQIATLPAKTTCPSGLTRVTLQNTSCVPENLWGRQFYIDYPGMSPNGGYYHRGNQPYFGPVMTFIPEGEFGWFLLYTFSCGVFLVLNLVSHMLKHCNLLRREDEGELTKGASLMLSLFQKAVAISVWFAYSSYTALAEPNLYWNFITSNDQEFKPRYYTSGPGGAAPYGINEAMSTSNTMVNVIGALMLITFCGGANFVVAMAPLVGLTLIVASVVFAAINFAMSPFNISTLQNLKQFFIDFNPSFFFNPNFKYTVQLPVFMLMLYSVVESVLEAMPYLCNGGRQLCVSLTNCCSKKEEEVRNPVADIEMANPIGRKH